MIILSSNHSVDDKAFFVESMDWFAERLGGHANLISADLHRDEPYDHVHVLVVPLVDGRINGSQLLGGKGEFRRHKSDFEREMYRQYGSHLIMKAHFSTAQKVLALAPFIDVIHKTSDPVLSSPIWTAVKIYIHVQPEPYLGLLGLEPATYKLPKKCRRWQNHDFKTQGAS